jgi:hypothetical protein
MFRFFTAPAASCAVASLIFMVTTPPGFADPSADGSSSSSASTLQAIQVTAQRLNDARSSIETQTGASTYTIDSQAIAAMPGGENAQLNQVLLQAPDVVQDSFGQIHVRADHNRAAPDLTLANGEVIPNGDHTPSYNQINLGVSHAFDLGGSGPLTARFDVINVADKVYQIRSGSGVGVFAPQYGPRRGFFGGLSWKF